MGQKYKKLSQYAKDNGITYRTAWNYFNDGLLEGAYQNDKKTIFVPVDDEKKDNRKYAAIYARVSSNDRKKSLDNQLNRLNSFAATNGYIVNHSVKEIASGMNDNRNKLIKLLREDDYDVLIVENKDRLTRFGFNYIKVLLEKNKKELIVVNKVDNDKQDLIQDLVSVIYSFSARLYGNRRKTKKEVKDFLTI